MLAPYLIMIVMMIVSPRRRRGGRRRSTMDASGTYFTLRVHRDKGAVYAPTPVCYPAARLRSPEMKTTTTSTSRGSGEVARDGRGLNPDWSATEGGTWRGGREGGRRRRAGRIAELCLRDMFGRRRAGRKTTKGAVEETRGDATTTATRRWRRASASGRARHRALVAEVGVAGELSCVERRSI